jgi:hypothetical protein
MDEETTGRDSFDWRLPLCGAASALILFVPMMFDGSHLLETLYFFAAAPIISVVLLVDAIRKKGRGRLAALVMVVAYMATSWALIRHSLEIRGTTRWMLWSKDYKTRVLAQPNLVNRSLKHIEWDGWGFAAANTLEYLVFVIHFGPRRGAIRPGSSAAYLARSFMFAVWRAITTLFCFISARLGPL